MTNMHIWGHLQTSHRWLFVVVVVVVVVVAVVAVAAAAAAVVADQLPVLTQAQVFPAVTSFNHDHEGSQGWKH